jgi:uncharacterized protein (UPF0147 family)
MKQKTQARVSGTLDPLVRKSDVIRLLNEYLDDKDAPAHTRTVLRAIRHDVRHDLPNVPVRRDKTAPENTP